MYTRSQLIAMQKKQLYIKIGKAQARIMEYVREMKGRVYVSVSGGLDSVVLLYIVRQLYPETLGVYCDTRLDYPGNRQLIKTIPNIGWVKPKMRFQEVIEKYGYPVVSKELARAIYYARRGSEWALKKLDGQFKDGTPSDNYKRFIKYKHLLEAPFLISDACCNELKCKPMSRFETASGLHPITGMRAEESFLRQSAWMKHGCNALDVKRPISNPLSIWTHQDILWFIRQYKVPYSYEYGAIVPADDQLSLFEPPKLKTTGCRKTGCAACLFGIQNETEPNRFQLMKSKHPKLYSYCIDTLKCGMVMDYMNIKY